MNLDRAFAELRTARSQIVVSGNALLADMALLGFLDEVEESTEVARVILESPLPHRAAPHARTAFEAAQYALILVTEARYALAGARVWVYYCRKDRRIIEFDGEPAAANAWYSNKLKELATLWDQFSPGQGNLIEEARRIVEAQPRRPDNWCGVDPAKELSSRYDVVTKALGGQSPTGVREATSGAFTALSRGTHARIPDPATVLRRSDGSIHLLPASRDNEKIRQSLVAGLTSAILEAMLAAVYRAANAA